MDTKQALKCLKCKSVKAEKYTSKIVTILLNMQLMDKLLGQSGAIFALLYESDKSHFRCRFCGHRFAVKENRFVKEM
ncbi:TPA: hypothetical protein ACGO2Q_001892 [Streptococcus suis]